MKALHIFLAPGRVAALCQDVNFPVVAHTFANCNLAQCPVLRSPTLLYILALGAVG